MYQFRNGQIFEKEISFKGCAEWTPADDKEEATERGSESEMQSGTATFNGEDYEGSFKAAAARKNSNLNDSRHFQSM